MKSDLESALENLPDQIADALTKWRKATLEREKIEGLLYARLKGEDKRTGDEIKALIKSDPDRYAAVLVELTAESNYTRLYERLLSFKKLADHRTAF